jgi:hypothetical protein
MRITSRQLRQIIKEEVENMMREEDAGAQDTINVGPEKSTAEKLKGTRIGKIVSDLAAKQDALKRDLQANTVYSISIDGSFQAFSTPNGEGKLVLHILGPGASDPTTQAALKAAAERAYTSDSARAAMAKMATEPATLRLKFDVLDKTSGAKAPLTVDGSNLLKKVAGRIRRKLLAKSDLLGGFLSVEIPIKWMPNKVIIGDKTKMTSITGGTDYTADKDDNMGVSLMGMGFL